MMKNFLFLKKVVLLFAFNLVIVLASMAQTRVSGTITDAKTKEALVGVSVQIKGKVLGSITDLKGKFDFASNTPVPFTLVVSSVGYASQEVVVNAANSQINVSLKDQEVMGQEVVVSASRFEESVLKSPVTVEKLDLRAIKETAAPSFYDALGNIKGVDLTTQGLLFKSVNMRGFGSTGNLRVTQLIDGMDNQAPGLNFAVDNIVGMPELDVESVEVLPGAASALYGPNAINGLIMMKSKSPFLYQGLSATVKTGVMNEKSRTTATTPYYDLSIRYAKAINNKFAYKFNVAYLAANDWQGTNYTNLNTNNNINSQTGAAIYPAGIQNGTRGLGVNTDYDGTNIYGDEIRTSILSVAKTMAANNLIPQAAVGLVPDILVSRTGFLEKDLVDYNTKSLKFNGALHYRINEKVELIGQLNYGYGTTVYTGAARYSLRNFNITQAKLELKGDNFMIRGYTTQERSGQSYAAGLSALSMLNEINPNSTWYGQYVGAFVQARSAGQAQDAALVTARAYADKNQNANYASGSDALSALASKYNTMNIVNGGGAFADKSNLYHLEGYYNFKNEIKFMELSVGANFRQYQLRSAATLFADNLFGFNGSIPINEYGAYTQGAKSLFNNHLKLTGSIRYDKNQNFNGQFTPRVSGVYSFGENNIRVSYQSGFRIPTTQNQWINLQTAGGTLIGAMPQFTDYYKLTTGLPVAALTSANIAKYVDASVLASAQQYATAAITSQVTAGVTAKVDAAIAAGQLPAAAKSAAVQQGVAANLPAALAANLATVTTQVVPAYALAKIPKYVADALKPEQIRTYEIGYKGLIAKRLFIDAYYYQSKYINFIGATSIVVPTEPSAPGLPIESGVGLSSAKGYSRPSNAPNPITVEGWATSLNYGLRDGYNVGGNLSYNNLTGFTPSVQQLYAGFNTPKYRYNLNFGKRLGSGDKIGFNISYRHQNAFLWESSFVQPSNTALPSFTNTMVPAINNLDAQVSFKMPAMKSIIKIGGTNLGGKSYYQAFGSALVGSMYYVSISYDDMFNK